MCVCAASDLSPGTDPYSHLTDLIDARIMSVQRLPTSEVMVGFTYSTIIWITRVGTATLRDDWVYEEQPKSVLVRTLTGQ